MGNDDDMIHAPVLRDAIAALPTVTMRVKPLAWYRPDGVHHTVTVEHAKAFGFTYCAYGGGAWGMEAPHYQHNLSEGNRTLEAAKAAAQADYEARILAALEPVTQPAPDADDSYPYDAIEQCERDLDGAEDEPVVNEKLRTMHQEYLLAIEEGRLVTDAVSPTDARLRAAVAQLDAGDVREAALRQLASLIAGMDAEAFLDFARDIDAALQTHKATQAADRILALLTEKPHDR